MRLKLYSARHGYIDCNSIVPSHLTDYLLPGSTHWGGCWPYGELLIQEWDWEPHIRYSTYLFYEEDQLRMMEDVRHPLLYFILQNNFHGHWAEMGARDDLRWTCNMLTVQHYDYTLDGCPNGMYGKVEFGYSPRQLSEVSPYFPHLKKMLIAGEAGISTVLYPTNLPASSITLARIGEVLQTSYQDSIRKLYTSAKNMQLLIDTLNTPTPSPKFNLH